jgi:glutathione synthase/RimK-type ligase-like ATP-grasp enzyme
VLALWPRATVAIEMDGLKYVKPLRGQRFFHSTPGKLREAEALERIGVSVPPLVLIEPDTVLNPNEWGPYVVVKPVFGRRGAFVQIRRTTRVRYQDPVTLPTEHYGRNGMIAQRFVYTGRWPVSYRVVTYFGRVITAIRFRGRCHLPPLEGPADFNRAGGHSIVASAMGSRIETIDEPDILDLARRAHDAFPGIPSLGVDIIREAESRRLFVLETNPYGRSWLLETSAGRKIERDFSIDLHAQFDALSVITDASIEVARKYAR